MRDYGVRVYAIAGEDAETYERHIAEVVATNPQIIMDDGAIWTPPCTRSSPRSWKA